MLGLINLGTLVLLGYIDFVSYKIPNVILCGWLGTVMILKDYRYTTPIEIFLTVIGVLIATGSYIPLRRIVRCSAGDFKLFAVLTVAMGIDDMLTILIITLLITTLPLVCGVRKVPVAMTTGLGYIAFLLSRRNV